MEIERICEEEGFEVVECVHDRVDKMFKVMVPPLIVSCNSCESDLRDHITMMNIQMKKLIYEVYKHDMELNSEDMKYQSVLDSNVHDVDVLEEIKKLNQEIVMKESILRQTKGLLERATKEIDVSREENKRKEKTIEHLFDENQLLKRRNKELECEFKRMERMHEDGEKESIVLYSKVETLERECKELSICVQEFKRKEYMIGKLNQGELEDEPYKKRNNSFSSKQLSITRNNSDFTHVYTQSNRSNKNMIEYKQKEKQQQEIDKIKKQEQNITNQYENLLFF